MALILARPLTGADYVAAKVGARLVVLHVRPPMDAMRIEGPQRTVNLYVQSAARMGVPADGRLEVGEASVVVGTASAHRDEAYQASRYVIEQLKVRSPIWKQEHYVDGDSAWLRGHPLRAGPAVFDRVAHVLAAARSSPAVSSGRPPLVSSVERYASAAASSRAGSSRSDADTPRW